MNISWRVRLGGRSRGAPMAGSLIIDRVVNRLSGVFDIPSDPFDGLAGGEQQTGGKE